VDDVLMGQWKQIRGKIKEFWGDLTDDDLDRLIQYDQLVGVLQRRTAAARSARKRIVEFRDLDLQSRTGAVWPTVNLPQNQGLKQ
jgi:uncharacterized protein YjbJ (UPF0337 family)